jgi:hypothetical protein
MGLDVDAGPISRGILKVAAAESRDAKNAKTREELQALWDTQAKELGFAQAEVAALVNNKFVEITTEEIADIAYLSLSELTANHAVFREPALVTKVANALLGKASPDQILEAVEKLKRFELMTTIAVDERTSLKEQVYTTREMLLTEYQLSRLANRQDGRHEFKDVVLADTLKPEQRAAALHVIKDANAVSVMEGGAGSGKSYTLGKVAHAYASAGYKTTGISGSWYAALNLAREAKLEDGRAITVWINDLKKGAIRLTEKDVILVDEAGMIGATQMRDILKFAARGGSKVVLAGDTRQQKVIAAGDPLRQIVKEIGSASLDQIVLQERQEDRQAAKDFFEGHAEKGLASYIAKNQVHIIANEKELHARIVSDWQKSRIEYPGKEHLIIASTRADVKALNQLAHETRKANGELGEFRNFQTMDCGKGEESMEFSVGDQVVIRITSKHDDVSNRTMGTITGFDGPIVHLQTETGPLAIDSSLEQSQFKNDKGERKGFGMQHRYCMTTFASRGMTVDHSFFMDSTALHRVSAAMGTSRHREDCNIYIDRQARYEAKLRFCSAKDWHSIDNFSDAEILARVATSWSKEQTREAAMDFQKWRKCGGEVDISKEDSIEKILEEAAMNVAERAVQIAQVQSHIAKINPGTAKALQHAVPLQFQMSDKYVLNRPKTTLDEIKASIKTLEDTGLDRGILSDSIKKDFITFDGSTPMYLGARPHDGAVVNICSDGEQTGALRNRFPPILDGESSHVHIVATGEDALHVWTYSKRNNLPLPTVIVGPTSESLSMPHTQDRLIKAEAVNDHSLPMRLKEQGLESEAAPEQPKSGFVGITKNRTEQNSPQNQAHPKAQAQWPSMDKMKAENLQYKTAEKASEVTTQVQQEWEQQSEQQRGPRQGM